MNNIICEICKQSFSTKGFNGHLSSHNISVTEYVKLYGEFRQKYLKQLNSIKNFKCLICDIEFETDRQLSYHLRIEHTISKSEYIKEFIYKNEKQFCKCGCNTEVKILDQYPYRRDYISGHNSIGTNNPMSGKRHLNKTTLQTMSEKACKRIGKTNKVNTKPELEFKNFLELNGIKHKHQIDECITEYGVIDFYLIDYDLLVEIDGLYWHPEEKINLNFQLLSSAISEKKKEKISNLIRIKDIDIEKLKTVDDLYTYNYQINTKLSYKQKIINKDYFKNYIDKNGYKHEKYVWLLLKFIRNYQPNFPIDDTKYELTDVISKIKNNVKQHNSDNNFNNNCSSIGVGYLKSIFYSFWNSNYKNSITPIEAWNDDDIMREVIKYRIGINNSAEVFDFSLHQLIRGLSARRYTISFFKPVLAANIYNFYLGDNESPVVFDPCSGFGGRLLGFKSVYPNGTYIGLEPNIDTFNELNILKDKLNTIGYDNIYLYNQPVEDFNLDFKFDLAFTSIPYFDVETYSNVVNYNSYDSWIKSFMNKILKLNNFVLNIPEFILNDLNLKSYLDKLIVHNSSHFSRTKTKHEYLIKMNF